jgi:hypothetical protein
MSLVIMNILHEYRMSNNVRLHCNKFYTLDFVKRASLYLYDSTTPATGKVASENVNIIQSSKIATTSSSNNCMNKRLEIMPAYLSHDQHIWGQYYTNNTFISTTKQLEPMCKFTHQHPPKELEFHSSCLLTLYKRK